MDITQLSDQPLTELIIEWQHGNKTAYNELFSLCYQQFRQEVRKQNQLQKLRQQQDQNCPLTLCIESTTSIIHDAYLKLEKQHYGSVEDRKQLLLLIAKVVRSIMIDQYRKIDTQKRTPHSELPIASVTQNEGEIYKSLEQADASLTIERKRSAEILRLSFYVALSNQEIAKIYNISLRTVQNELKFAKAWYQQKLCG
ncbi:MAG: sigma-70 family RNA polymerase sigma factor [Gammaproteobacteria bacterium]|nr:sigma-70 family RNA polymerase sigma factor [Gammaproteobacteria bacterium]